MDIITKYQIVEKIIQSNDEILLNEVKSLLGLSNDDFWKDLPEEIKNAVHLGKGELDRGEGISHDQYLNKRL